MALIKCEECGQMVSDKAESCPNCGAPIKGETNKEVKEAAPPVSVETPKASARAKAKPTNKKPLIAVVAAVLVVVVGIGLWLSSGNNEEIVKITPEFARAVQKYESLHNFSDGMAAVKNKKDKWGFINTKGQEIVPCKYAYVNDFSDGMAAVKNDNEKWGFVNKTGKEVIPCQYAEVADFSEGLASVSMQELYSDKEEDYLPITYINKKGKNVINGYFYYFPRGYILDIYRLHDGVCFAYDKNHNKVWYDGKGKVVAEPKDWESYGEEVDSPNWDIFREDEKFGVKDSTGKVIVPAKYSGIGEISCGVARANLSTKNNGYESKYGYVDAYGNDTFTEADWIADRQYEEEMKRLREENDRKRREKEQRERRAAMSWLQGTWTINTTYDPEKIVISGDKITVYLDGTVIFSGTFECEEDRICYGSNDYVSVDNSKHRLMADVENYYTKVSFGSSSGGGSSRQPYQFFNPTSVLDYLQNKTFYGYGTSVRITFQGVFIKGSCMTGAPRVVSYNGYNAVVAAAIVGMGQNLTVSVDSYNHIITDRSNGCQYRLK